MKLANQVIILLALVAGKSHAQSMYNWSYMSEQNSGTVDSLSLANATLFVAYAPINGKCISVIELLLTHEYEFQKARDITVIHAKTLFRVDSNEVHTADRYYFAQFFQDDGAFSTGRIIYDVENAVEDIIAGNTLWIQAEDIYSEETDEPVKAIKFTLKGSGAAIAKSRATCEENMRNAASD